LLVLLLLYSSVPVLLEERIDAFLVYKREARVLLYRYSEAEPKAYVRSRKNNCGRGRRGEGDLGR
jgi:hypothetical protein